MQSVPTFEEEVRALTVPPPLVRFRDHPLTWLKQKLVLLVAAIVLAYLGMLSAAGAYYMITQVWEPANNIWHKTFSSDDFRHLIRDVGEGLMGGLLAQQVVWNHYKKRSTVRNKLDNFEIKLHIANLKDGKRLSWAQLMVSPVLAVIYAIPGFLVGWAIASLFHGNIHDMLTELERQTNGIPLAGGVGSKLMSLWTVNWDKKLIGYGASFFFGRRPVKGVFDDLQLWFAERNVAHGQHDRWYHTAPYTARCNDVAERGELAPGFHGFWWNVLVRGTLGLMVASGLLGLYVLMFIAK